MKLCYAQLNIDKGLELFLSGQKKLRVNIDNDTFLSLRILDLYLFRIDTVLGDGLSFEEYYVGLGVCLTKKQFEEIFIVKEVWEI